MLRLILIVDDDDTVPSILTEKFAQRIMYNVAYISDGQTLLKFISLVKPVLFILGHQPGRINGIVLYDQLRARHEFREVPVLMIGTVLPLDEIEKRKINSLEKPFDAPIFLDIIERLLR